MCVLCMYYIYVLLYISKYTFKIKKKNSNNNTNNIVIKCCYQHVIPNVFIIK